jgi:sugar phosphate isomerase/epimerase
VRAERINPSSLYNSVQFGFSHAARHKGATRCDASQAGADVLTYFARFPGCFPLLHLKDLDRAGEITDLGWGTINFAAVLHATTCAGVRHMFVEHDRARDPLASPRSSFEHVRAL